MTKVLVAGSKAFEDYELLKGGLDEILKEYDEVELVSGHSIGADMLAEKYAEERNIPIRVFIADWKKDWKRAGFKRNTQMVEYISDTDAIVVAFWNGVSHGTKDTLDKAEAKGIRTVIKKFQGGHA